MESTWGPGKVIAGRYCLADQLGQGGMGSVWRAEHLTLRSTIAVKLIDPEIAGKAEMLERFQREAQAAASLRSPHVVQILDYGVDEGVPYIAMELLEGESLAARLLRARPLPYSETARFVTHVARALARAHEAGIVHRDLKPDNVFLVRNDDQEIAKVLDFGVAKHGSLGSGKGPTRTGNILGTPGYMSPEQAQGTKAVDGRSDLWALGVIAYECVVGQVPFESEALGDLLLKICVQPIPVPSQHAQVPPGFDAWFARACCRDVEQRFQTAKDLAEALRALLTPDADRSSGAISAPGAAAGAGLPNAATVVAASTPFSGPGPEPAPPRSPGGTEAAGPHRPGVTVPGMSVGLRVAPKRHTGAVVAAIALVAVAVGGATTSIVLGGRRAPPSAATSALAPMGGPESPPKPAQLTMGGPESPPKPPGIQVPAVSQAEPSPPTVVPASSAEVPPVPSAKLRAPVVHAAPVVAAPPHPAAPAPHPGSDQRLGF